MPAEICYIYRYFFFGKWEFFFQINIYTNAKMVTQFDSKKKKIDTLNFNGKLTIKISGNKLYFERLFSHSNW